MGDSNSTLPSEPFVEKVKELSPWHTLQNPGLGVGFTEDEKHEWWESKDYKYKLGTIRSIDLDKQITIYSETFDMSKKQKKIKPPPVGSNAYAPDKTYVLKQENLDKIHTNTGMYLDGFDEELIQGNLDTMKTVTQFEDLYLGWLSNADEDKDSVIIKETMKTLFRFVFGKKSINDKNKAERFYAHLRFAYTKFGPEEKVPCKGTIADNFRQCLEYRLAGVKKEIIASMQTGFPEYSIYRRGLYTLEKGLIQMIDFLDSKSGCFEYGEYSGDAKRTEDGEDDDQNFLRALMVAKQIVESDEASKIDELKGTFLTKANGVAAEILEQINKALSEREGGDFDTKAKDSEIEGLKAEVEKLKGEVEKLKGAGTDTAELAAAKQELEASRIREATARREAAAARAAAARTGGAGAADARQAAARAAAAQSALTAAQSALAAAQARVAAAEAGLATSQTRLGASETSRASAQASLASAEASLAAAEAALAAAQAEKALSSNNTTQLKKTILVLMFSLIRSRRAFELLSAQMDESEEVELQRIMRDVDEKIAGLPEEARPLVKGIFDFLTEKPVEGEPIEVLKDLIRRKGEAQKIIEYANRLENPLRLAAVTSVEEGIQSIDALIRDLREKLEAKEREILARLRGLRESFALTGDAKTKELAKLQAELDACRAALDECNKIKGAQEVTISVLEAKIAALGLPESKRGDIDERLAAFQAALTANPGNADGIKARFAAKTAEAAAEAAEEAARLAAQAAEEEAAAAAASAAALAASEAAAAKEKADSEAAIAAANERARAAEEAADSAKREAAAKDALIAAATEAAKSADEALKQREAAAREEVAAATAAKTAADQRAAALEREKDSIDEAARMSAAASKSAFDALQEARGAAAATESAALSAAMAQKNAAEDAAAAAVAEKEAAEAALKAAKNSSAKEKEDAAAALKEATDAAAAATKAADEANASADEKVAAVTKASKEAASTAAKDLDKAKKEAASAKALFEAAGGQIARGQAAIDAVEAAKAEAERLRAEMAGIKGELTRARLGVSPEISRRQGEELAKLKKDLATKDAELADAQRLAAEAAAALNRSKDAEEALAAAKAAAAEAEARVIEIANLAAAAQTLHGAAIERHGAISEENQKLIGIVVKFIEKIKGGPVQPTVESIERELDNFPNDAQRKVEAALALIDAIRNGTDKKPYPIERIEGVLRNTEPDTSAAEAAAAEAEAKRAAEAEAKKAANAAAEAKRAANAAAAEAEAEAKRAANAAAAEAEAEAEAEEVPPPPIEENIADTLRDYAYILLIKDGEDTSIDPVIDAYNRLKGDPTDPNNIAFIALFNKWIEKSTDLDKVGNFLLNRIISKELNFMDASIPNTSAKPVTSTSKRISYTNIYDIYMSLKEKVSTVKEGLLTFDEKHIIPGEKRINGLREGLLVKLSNDEFLTTKMRKYIENTFSSKQLLFFMRNFDFLKIKISALIATLLEIYKKTPGPSRNNFVHESISRMNAMIALKDANKKIDDAKKAARARGRGASLRDQSGGSQTYKSSKASNLCDLILSSMLLKLDGPEFNYQALIDKARRTLDDIGQCDLILEMLNHLIDEHCLIKKTDGYNFSSVYMDISQARALVEAFNNNFTDSEKQKFYSISNGIFNYKVPDEQILLGKHPFFLVGKPRETEEGEGEIPLYGVLDEEIMLTMEERSVLEENSIPIGAILFLYVVCFRENEGHFPLGSFA